MDPTPASNLAALPSPDEQTETHRTPPLNYEAEQALLGALLANNRTYERVADFLRPAHFADGAHGRIFEACGKLIERGQMANAVTLKNFFEQDEALAEVGGARYLANLESSFVTIINATDYGRTIHDLFLRRELIDLGEEVVNDAFAQDLEISASNQIETAEQKLYNLAEAGWTEGGLRDFKSAVTQAVEMAEAAYNRDGHISGVTTGFKDLDRVLGGLHPSDLIILAGRPSMGKTALATNITYNVATAKRRVTGTAESSQGSAEVVAFFSLEMSAEQLATRLISQHAGVSSDKIRRGGIGQVEFDRIFEASRRLHDLSIFIDDTPALTLPALRTRARRLKRQHGLSLIVVDYLQLMQGPPGFRTENRVQEVSEITRGLKAVAKELNVPVLALSQLSRQTEQRDDKRPQLADLRESGSIEQDADVVMFIFREEYYKAREKPSQKANESDKDFNERQADWTAKLEKVRRKAEVIIAKQRHGPIDTIDLQFTGEFTEFNDLIASDQLPDVPF